MFFNIDMPKNTQFLKIRQKKCQIDLAYSLFFIIFALRIYNHI